MALGIEQVETEPRTSARTLQNHDLLEARIPPVPWLNDVLGEVTVAKDLAKP
jgi:hypothetical protein